MNAFLSASAVRLNPAIGIVITLAGALVGGKLAGDAPLGILLGLIAGSAIAIGLCGTVAMLGQVVDAIEQPSAAKPVSASAAIAIDAPAATMANGHYNGANGAASNGAAAVASAEDEDLATMLQTGRFAAYHLAKGHRAFAAGDFKDAAYQASASLSHDPKNPAAVELRALAKKNRK